jgi:hypothetical protein
VIKSIRNESITKNIAFLKVRNDFVVLTPIFTVECKVNPFLVRKKPYRNKKRPP